MQKRAWEIVAIILAITLTAVAIFVLVNRNRSTAGRLTPESGAPRAENLINVGKYPEAVRIIDEIIKREPQNDYAWLLRYRATEPEGFIESARVSLDKAHQLNPRNPEYLYEMGRAANRDGEPDRAMEYFRKAKELGFPRQPDLVMAMAEASLTQAVYFPQRRAQSLALCRNYAQEAQRTFQNPLVAAGVDAQAAYAQGKPGEVLTILKPILAEQKPGDGSSGQVDGYVCAVVAAMELGQRDQAQKLIDRGIEMFASAQNKPHYYYFRPYAEALLLYRDIHFSPPITLASYDTREQLFKKLENSGVFCPASSRNTQKRMHDFLAARQHKDQQGMMDALKGLIMMYGHQDNRNACAEYLLMLRPMLRMSALVELGDLYAAQGKKAEALACYQEAGREMPRETIVKERIATLN